MFAACDRRVSRARPTMPSAIKRDETEQQQRVPADEADRRSEQKTKRQPLAQELRRMIEVVADPG